MTTKNRKKISNIDYSNHITFMTIIKKYYYYIPLLAILVLGTISTIYHQKKLNKNIDIIDAVVTSKSHNFSKGTRWSNMSYEYYYSNNVYRKTETISNKMYSKISIGDTITIIVNIDNPKISQWKE